MTRIWRVNYHGGSLFSLVKADTSERAIEVARGWREREFTARLNMAVPDDVRDDSYTVRLATERDIAWAAEFGCRPYSDMPPPSLGKRATARPRPRPAPDTGERDETSAAPIAGVSVAMLNIGWRVVEERLQWIIQRRGRREWKSRRFCTTRSVLIRDVRELCGKVSAEALEVLEALPDRHPGLVAYETANLARMKGRKPPPKALPRSRTEGEREDHADAA